MEDYFKYNYFLTMKKIVSMRVVLGILQKNSSENQNRIVMNRVKTKIPNQVQNFPDNPSLSIKPWGLGPPPAQIIRHYTSPLHIRPRGHLPTPRQGFSKSLITRFPSQVGSRLDGDGIIDLEHGACDRRLPIVQPTRCDRLRINRPSV